MAYSLGDLFRPLRFVLRLNGLLLCGAPGLFFLLARRATFVRMGIIEQDGDWPLRVMGATLVSFALYFLLASNERVITLPALLTTLTLHVLLALVLLLAYLSGEFATLSLMGRVGLIFIFILCLVGALSPIRYFQAEFRSY